MKNHVAMLMFAAGGLGVSAQNVGVLPNVPAFQALDRQFHVAPVALGHIPSMGQIPHTTPITANNILRPFLSPPTVQGYPVSHGSENNGQYQQDGPAGSGNPSSTSSGPSEPGTSSGPGESSTPSGPSNPPAPSGPSNPPAPSGPSNPPAPSGPNNPPAPSGPSNPPAPSGPSSPPASSGPSESSTPSGPSNPSTESGSSGSAEDGEDLKPTSSSSQQNAQTPPPPPPVPVAYNTPDLDDVTGISGPASESGPVGQEEANEVNNAKEEEAMEINDSIKADDESRDAMTTLREKHDAMLTHLYNFGAKMMVARGTDDHDEIHDTLTSLEKGLTGIMVTEKEQRLLNRLTVERAAKAKEQAHKTKLAELNKKEKEVALKESLGKAKSTHERRCLQWTERVDEANMFLNKAFKAAMVSSTTAQQGAAANQNDQITQYQLKWSLEAINEVKCTLKLLLALKKNKLTHCRLVNQAKVAFLKLNNTMMPPYETPGLIPDKTIAQLSLTRARAQEKTKVARQASTAVKTAVEKSGIGKTKSPPEDVDKETGEPKEGKETTEMMFERIMGRPLNLKWDKPAPPKHDTLDSAVTGCLGGKCILSPIDMKNDMEGKKLARG